MPEDLVTLGKLAPGSAQRDAIHMACLPVIAKKTLNPGQEIGLIGNNATDLVAKKLGIVDPFLKEPVREGQRFWMMLFQKTITSLRHDWNHPEIDNDSTPVLPSISEAYLREAADITGLPYDEFMAHIESFTENGEHKHMGSNENYSSVNWNIFWEHYERFTGKKVHADRWCPFSCAC